MAIEIVVNQKGARADVVRKIVEDAIKAKYPEASVFVTRKESAESRSARFDEALGLVGDARGQAEDLKQELEDWKDNLPENLQDSDKASQIDEAVSSIEEFIDALETAEGVSVDFPGMY